MKKPKKPRPVSLRGYAKHRRCHLSTVQQARDDGRITVDANGKIPDVTEADRQWAANTREEHTPLTGPGAKKRKGPRGSSSVELPPLAAADDTGGFRAARTRRETALAEIAEVEARRLSGGSWLPASAFHELEKKYTRMFAFVVRFLRHKLPLAVDKYCNVDGIVQASIEAGKGLPRLADGSTQGPLQPSARMLMYRVQDAVDEVCTELAEIKPGQEPVL